MAVVGLVFSALIYLSLIALLFFILFFFIRKKYTFSYQLMMILFLHGLISIMCLSWGIVIMSKGFNVSLQVYFNNDYTWIVFVFIGLLFLLVSMDIVIKKHIEKENNVAMQVSRYFLPVLNVIVITICTILFYSSCCYLRFLTL